MGKAQQKVKARRRLRKPKKVYTNAPVHKKHAAAWKSRKKVKVKPTNKPLKLKAPRKSRKAKKATIPRYLQLPLYTRKAKLNRYGMPRYTTPKRVRELRNRVVNTWINRGLKPSDVGAIKHNYAMLLRAMKNYERAKKLSTKEKWLKDIKELSKNANLLGFTSTTYDDATGKKVGHLRGKNADDEETKRIRDFYFRAEDDDDYDDGSGRTFSNALFYSTDETSDILNKMGGDWDSKVARYADDVIRIVNNTGYEVSEYKEYYVNGKPLGAPDSDKVQLKRFVSYITKGR